jgi:hypothetical protein
MREVLFWLGIAAGFLLAVWMYISMFLLPADQSPDPRIGEVRRFQYQGES